MEVKQAERRGRSDHRRAVKGGAWRMAMAWWTRTDYGWTMKLVLACCIALFLFSPALSRNVPSDSKNYLGRSLLLARSTKAESTHDKGEEIHGRMRREEESDDEYGDYSTPTHNHNGPSPPSVGDSPVRFSQQRYNRFNRYTAHYGHRHPRNT